MRFFFYALFLSVKKKKLLENAHNFAKRKDTVYKVTHDLLLFKEQAL